MDQDLNDQLGSKEDRATSTATRKGRSIDWTKVDWTLPSGKIATYLGVGSGSVSRARQIYAPETVGRIYPKRRFTKRDWELLEWTKSTIDLALETGFSKITIHQNRHKFAPHTLKTRKKRASDNYEATMQRINWKSVSNSFVSKKTGASRCTVARYRRVLAPETRYAGLSLVGVDWAKVNWRLDNVTLAKRLGRSSVYVSSIRKCLAILAVFLFYKQEKSD